MSSPTLKPSDAIIHANNGAFLMRPVELDTDPVVGAVVDHGSGATVFGPIGLAVPATASLSMTTETAVASRPVNTAPSAPLPRYRSSTRRPGLRLAFGQGGR
jgi:hypothetical protein